MTGIPQDLQDALLEAQATREHAEDAAAETTAAEGAAQQAANQADAKHHAEAEAKTVALDAAHRALDLFTHYYLPPAPGS